MPSYSAPYDDYERQLRSLREDAQSLIEGLSATQANWRPESGGWSIAQCLDHLKVVDGAYVKALEAGIGQADARDLRPDGAAMRYNFFERTFISSMEPPPKMKVKAPKSVVPPSELDIATVGGKYLGINQQLLDLLPAASRVHPRKAKIRSPLAKFIKLSVGAAYALLAAHDRRHLWQARNLMANGQFPN